MSRKYAPQAAAAGCIVIDNTSEFRYQDDIPLVVPEVNPHAIARVQEARHHRQPELLDHPDAGRAQAASTTRSASTRINVATYQSVSGAGKEAVDELAAQTVALMSGSEPRSLRSSPMPKRRRCTTAAIAPAGIGSQKDTRR